MISVSGMFAVTFSIAFAYVADCTEQSERSTAYGLVRRHCYPLHSKKTNIHVENLDIVLG